MKEEAGHFNILKKDPKSSARTATLKLAHGTVETPMFMSVGTAGTVKTISQENLVHDLNAPLILGNTYHLYLRPGLEVLQAAGGLHKFMKWDRPILTDSGGYQVYSLAKKRKITEEGAKFQSHIDGSYHMLSPEKSMEIQRIIGGDIIMAFDECTPFPCEKRYARKSMHLTHRWEKRCFEYLENHPPLWGHDQVLFPIVQGSVYTDLRKESAEAIANFGAMGNAIGGLSVGEPAEMLYAMTDTVCQILPEDKPRYLMGVGTPANLLECIALGIDMFDCVMPTRNARNGQIFTMEGIINIKNKKWQMDFSPIDADATNLAGNSYSKAYLRHLIIGKETLGLHLATLQNLGLYLRLMEECRNQIKAGTFSAWKDVMVEKLARRL